MTMIKAALNDTDIDTDNKDQEEDPEPLLDLEMYYNQGKSPALRLLPDPLPDEDVLWIPPQLCKSSYELLGKLNCNSKPWHLEGRFGSRTYRVGSYNSNNNNTTTNDRTIVGSGENKNDDTTDTATTTTTSTTSTAAGGQPPLLALPILSKQLVLDTAKSHPELQALLDTPHVQLAHAPFAASHWARPPPHIDARIHPERTPQRIPKTIPFRKTATNDPKRYSFTFAELFAGIGGFGVALEAMGGQCIFCSELEAPCRKLYQQNLHCPPESMHGDIYQVPDTALPSPPGSCDLLVGGFPCQPFSALGTQPGLECPKGHLFLEIVRVLKVSQPKAFLLENVPGLKQLTTTYETILDALEEAGYTVSTEVCNARALTATARKRLFFVGIRRGLQQPPQPMQQKTQGHENDDAVLAPSSEKDDDENGFKFPFIPDMGIRALDVIDYFLGETNTTAYDIQDRAQNDTETDNVNVESNKKDSNEGDILHDDKHLVEILRLSETTFQQLLVSKRWKPAALAWPGTVLETLISHYGTAVGRGESQLVPCRAHQLPRRFSPRECARLMGFPNSYVLGHRRDEHQGDMAYVKERYRMFGNAVCPPLVAALAGAVLNAVLGHGQGDGREEKGSSTGDSAADWVEWGRQTAIRLALAATIPKESRRPLPMGSLPFDNIPRRNPEKKRKNRKGKQPASAPRAGPVVATLKAASVSTDEPMKKKPRPS